MDNIQAPKISILIPTRDRGELLVKAVKSVLNQSFKDWELIVIDNGEKTVARDALESAGINNPRIIILKAAPRAEYEGIAPLLNSALSISRGEYIARLDDDDEWCYEDKLKEQAEYLDHNPLCAVVGGGVIVINEKGEEVFRYLKPETDLEIRRVALLSNPLSHTTVMFRKEAAQKVGGYILRYAEDWDLWLRLGREYKLHNIPKYFTKYLSNEKNYSFTEQKPQSKMLLKIIWANKEYYPGFVCGFLVNLGQYIYSLLPTFIRTQMHPIFSRIKRSL